MMPERIGRYQLLEPLGRGAIGEVYRARDPDLDREVAIKIISRPDTLDTEELRRRFRREVQLAAHLHHPHIITVHDVGLDHDPPFLVTELLAGGTLKTHLQGRSLPWPEALALLQPICQALAYAHEAGIVHRDVKPDNIMFAKEDPQTLKLADFGLAHRADTDRLTQSGVIMGTIAYMSPEQANGEAVDPRTDIYSLGLILFETIGGYNPQRGETVSQTLAKAVSYTPIDLSELNEVIPPQVTALLHQALAKDRRARYGNCRLLCQDMARCLEQGAEVAKTRPAAVVEDTASPVESSGVQIKNVSGVELPPNAGDILRLMFDGYRQVTIREELGGGFSGSRVFLVRPVRDERRQELPAVLKLAPIRLIEQEWQAYQSTIRDQLSGVAQIQGEPVLPLGSHWGGLRYRLAGSGAIEFESLHRAYRRATVKDMRFLLAERLFKRLGALWRFNVPAPDFYLGASYDHLLPVNLVIQPGAGPADGTVPVIRAGEVSIPYLAPGDRVRLSGFVVTEVEKEDQAVTLNWPPADGATPASSRVRLQPVPNLENFQVNQIADGLEGVVTATRQEMLRAQALQTFGWDFNAGAAKLAVVGGRNLPNPLLRLPAVLAATPTVRLASIHGDLNPENILVDPATWDVRLIDFATARQDHVLHDFLRLETGIVTRLLVETLAEAGLSPESIVRLYEQVHCASFARPRRPSPDLASPALEKPFAMLVTLRESAQTYFYDPADWREYYQGLTLYLLGALKFKNLDETAKKAAFWGAAAVLGFLDKPPPCPPEARAVSTAGPTYQEAPENEPIVTKPAVTTTTRKEARSETLEEPAGETPIIAQPAGENRIQGWLAHNWLPALLVTALLAILIIAYIQSRNGNGSIAEEPNSEQPVVAVASPTVEASDTPRPSPTATLRPTFTPPPPTPRPSVTVPFIDVASQEATIAILLDTSISMNQDQKIIEVLSGVNAFIDRLDPDDEVVVYTYGRDVRQLQPSGRVADVREDLKQRIGSLFADGDTLLYDALCQSLEYLANETAGEDRLNGIVFLTDGQDAGQGAVTSEEEALACLASAGEQVDIQMITLAYGPEADVELLERLAQASNGQSFIEFPDTIHERFLTISFEN